MPRTVFCSLKQFSNILCHRSHDSQWLVTSLVPNVSDQRTRPACCFLRAATSTGDWSEQFGEPFFRKSVSWETFGFGCQVIASGNLDYFTRNKCRSGVYNIIWIKSPVDHSTECKIFAGVDKLHLRFTSLKRVVVMAVLSSSIQSRWALGLELIGLSEKNDRIVLRSILTSLVQRKCTSSASNQPSIYTCLFHLMPQQCTCWSLNAIVSGTEKAKGSAIA